MGLFTLVACSEDSYQEADKMNENTTVENSSGGIQTNSVDPAIPYESPFEGFYGYENIPHTIDNQLGEEIEIVAHWGLAYYDGLDDGTHFIQDLLNSQTPYLYLSNLTEYLNTVNSQKIIYPPNSTTVAQQANRCPIYWDSPPALPLEDIFDPEETEIIAQYGKMYFVDLNIPSIGYSTRIKVKYGDDTMDFAALSSISSDWDLIGGNITGIPGDLVYNLDTKEICLANNATGTGLNSEESFVYSGQTWYVRAYTDVNGVYIEVNQ